MEKKREKIQLMKEKLEVMEKMMEMQEKMQESQEKAKRGKKENQDILMIQIDDEERLDDDETRKSLEPKTKVKDAREKIEEKRRLSQEKIAESLKVTIHQTPKGEKAVKGTEKKNQEVQTPGSRLERHPNEVIGRRLLDRVGDVHWRHFPGINSLTDFNCDPCMKFNRESCDQPHPHKEGGRWVRDICEINNHHSAENCDLESKLDSFVARQKRQEREQHNKRHMRGEEEGKGAKRRKEEKKPNSK